MPKGRISIQFRKLHKRAVVPKYQSAEAAGADLHACLDEPVDIAPGEIELIKAGFALDIPKGYEVQLRPRSGLALKHGITVLNSPATIDSDYRGEIMVILINHGKETFRIEHGERIAQMVVAKHETVVLQEVDELSETARGTNGLGSTGK